MMVKGKTTQNSLLKEWFKSLSYEESSSVTICKSSTKTGIESSEYLSWEGI